MRMNHRSDVPITLHAKIVEEVKEFTYLGSKNTTDGDSESEIKARLSKAGQAFASLKNIWKSKKISLKTKLRFFKSNVLTTLLYGCESRKTSKRKTTRPMPKNISYTFSQPKTKIPPGQYGIWNMEVSNQLLQASYMFCFYSASNNFYEVQCLISVLFTLLPFAWSYSEMGKYCCFKVSFPS